MVVGILVLSGLGVGAAQLQVSESNRIVNNNIKLNTGYPLDSKSLCFPYGTSFFFGLIYNFQYEHSYNYFNCYNVICCIWDYHDECHHWYHCTNGEKIAIYGSCYSGILTDHFVFVLVPDCCI